MSTLTKEEIDKKIRTINHLIRLLPQQIKNLEKIKKKEKTQTEKIEEIDKKIRTINHLIRLLPQQIKKLEKEKTQTEKIEKPESVPPESGQPPSASGDPPSASGVPPSVQPIAGDIKTKHLELLQQCGFVTK